jgi:hypothetical protein
MTVLDETLLQSDYLEYLGPKLCYLPFAPQIFISLRRLFI